MTGSRLSKRAEACAKAALPAVRQRAELVLQRLKNAKAQKLLQCAGLNLPVVRKEADPSEQGYHVIVQPLNGVSFTVQAHSDELVDALCSRIQHLHGFKKQSQELYLEGGSEEGKLRPKCTLKEEGVVDGSTLYLILNMNRLVDPEAQVCLYRLERLLVQGLEVYVDSNKNLMVVWMDKNGTALRIARKKHSKKQLTEIRFTDVRELALLSKPENEWFSIVSSNPGAAPSNPENKDNTKETRFGLPTESARDALYELLQDFISMRKESRSCAEVKGGFLQVNSKSRNSNSSCSVSSSSSSSSSGCSGNSSNSRSVARAISSISSFSKQYFVLDIHGLRSYSATKTRQPKDIAKDLPAVTGRMMCGAQLDPLDPLVVELSYTLPAPVGPLVPSCLRLKAESVSSAQSWVRQLKIIIGEVASEHGHEYEQDRDGDDNAQPQRMRPAHTWV